MILSEPGRPCLCGALDCRSCGPEQGYYPEEDEEDDADEWNDRRRDEALMAADDAAEGMLS